MQSADFSAKPKIRPGTSTKASSYFREPHMLKIAPQNIMYDRRVVRGNTFAALVIPVSKLILNQLYPLPVDMQPDT